MSSHWGQGGGWMLPAVCPAHSLSAGTSRACRAVLSPELPSFYFSVSPSLSVCLPVSLQEMNEAGRQLSHSHTSNEEVRRDVENTLQ